MVGTVITPLVAKLKSISYGDVWRHIGSFLYKVITFGIPVWVIFVIIVTLVIGIRAMNKRDVMREPKLTSYTSDVIEGIQWEWDWIHTYSGLDFKGDSPVPICVQCKGNLIVSQDYHSFNSNILECENCGYKKKFDNDVRDYQGKIKREISRRIRTGTWKEKVRQ